VSVMHFGIALQELARRLLGLIEFALVYEIHDGVGVAGQFILTVIAEVTAEVATLMVVVVLGRCGGYGRSGLCQSGTPRASPRRTGDVVSSLLSANPIEPRAPPSSAG
jgi:hypothetical protein